MLLHQKNLLYSLFLYSCHHTTNNNSVSWLLQLIGCGVNLCNSVTHSRQLLRKTSGFVLMLLMHALLTLILLLYLDGAGYRGDCGDILFGSSF